MSKKRKLLVCLTACSMPLAVSLPSVWSFLSDALKLENVFSPGYLVTDIHEEFSSVAVDLSTLQGREVDKIVRFKNEDAVPCYIRVAVEFSNSDFDARLVNTSNSNGEVEGTDWVKKEDGWYYYTEVLHPGEETSVLFDKVIFENPELRYLRDVTEFQVIVSEESISRYTGKEFETYEEAWKFHMNARR